MKCDELKDYDIMDIEAMDDERLEKSESGKIQVTRVCIKSEVDAAIAELKAENEKLKSNNRILAHPGVEKIKENAELARQLRATKRALWLARAERAKAIQWHEGLDRYLQERKKYWPSRFCFMANDEMYHVWYKCWCEVERKCRAKAEEYK